MKKALLITTAAVGVLAIGTCFFGHARETNEIEKNKEQYAALQSSSSSSTKQTEESTTTKEESTSSSVTSTSTEEKEKSTPNTADYTIQSGDTLGGIAATCDITIDELLELNHWKREKTLMTGEVIKVPKDKVAALKKAKRRISKTVRTENTTKEVEKTVDTATSTPKRVERNVTPATSSAPIQSAPQASSVAPQPQQPQAPAAPAPAPVQPAPAAPVQQPVAPAPAPVQQPIQ